jgi:hypothetical protein
MAYFNMLKGTQTPLNMLKPAGDVELYARLREAVAAGSAKPALDIVATR